MTVTVWAVLVVVTSWPAKVSGVEGVRVTVGVPAVPIPLKTAICGLLEALSLIERVTGPRVPAALGVNVTLIMHEPPGAIVAPLVHVVAVPMANSVVAPRLGAAVRTRLALPVFSTVRVWAALGVLTSCPANVRVIGPGVMAPNNPSCSPLIPAVKYKVVELLPALPLPNSKVHNPEFTIGLPSESDIVPSKFPVVGSKALIWPRYRNCPTNRSFANVMNPVGAIVIPQGALRDPLEMSRCKKLPFVSKTLTTPCPAPGIAP